MAVPSISVPTTPAGWTHIGGPGMQLLIGSHEDDPRTHAASDAADTGDFDAVLDVLVSRGVRQAPPFAGVSWTPVHRIVVFGAVVATVTSADGEPQQVRATSSRVWTELELADGPERVTLEPEDSAAPMTSAAPATPVPHPDASAPNLPPPSNTAPSQAAVGNTAPSGAAVFESASNDVPAPLTGPRPGSAWSGNWMTVAPSPAEASAPARPQQSLPESQGSPAEVQAPPELAHAVSGPEVEAELEPAKPERTEPEPAPTTAEPTTAAPTTAAPTTVPPPAAPTGLAAWGSRAPMRAARREQPSAQPYEEPVYHSTLAGLPEGQPTPEPAPTPSSPPPPAPEPEPEPDEPAAPSYDYLFGRTSDAEAHRAMLAELDSEHGAAEILDDSDHSPATSSDPNAPVAEQDSTAAGLNPVPAEPVWNAEAAALPPAGGIISAVPWATPTPADKPATTVAPPTYTGHATPPPTPSFISFGPAIAPPAPTPAPEPEPAPELAHEAAPSPSPDPTTEPQPEPQPEPQREATVEAVEVGGIGGTEDDADADEATVDRAELLAAREAAKAQEIVGPSVIAVLCASGHPSPPHAATCRVCGQPVPSQEPFAMARPTLGTLTLSTGDVVELDRNVLIGRAPAHDPNVPPSERPHVLKVPSPERDISRNHVEVVLEGWHVLIRDLGSVNGTTVALPGQPEVRLRAHDQQVLEPGSRVTMAEDVSFTFEVSA